MTSDRDIALLFIGACIGLVFDAIVLVFTPYHDWFLDAAARDPCMAQPASEAIVASCPSSLPLVGLFGLIIPVTFGMAAFAGRFTEREQP